MPHVHAGLNFPRTLATNENYELLAFVPDHPAPRHFLRLFSSLLFLLLSANVNEKRLDRLRDGRKIDSRRRRYIALPSFIVRAAEGRRNVETWIKIDTSLVNHIYRHAMVVTRLFHEIFKKAETTSTENRLISSPFGSGNGDSCLRPRISSSLPFVRIIFTSGVKNI